jgi:hypothetical protein
MTILDRARNAGTEVGRVHASLGRPQADLGALTRMAEGSLDYVASLFPVVFRYKSAKARYLVAWKRAYRVAYRESKASRSAR